MECSAVHRIVEQHAANRGDAPAIICGRAATTYRDLNFRANVVARHLIELGFRRGDHAVVALPTGADLATVLLAVLKSGGSYTWEGAPAYEPAHAMIGRLGEDRSQYRRIDLPALLARGVRPGPNLPILTRPTDIACAVYEGGEPRPLLVPHATIAALKADLPTAAPVWEGDRTTFDLWTGLLAGAALSVEAPPALQHAA
jgi:non-ribosomal peptide synthetase component F